MTTTTTTTERVSVTAILADLILLQSRSGLPMPLSLDATSSNLIASVNVATLGDVKAWHDALGTNDRLTTSTYADRGPIHSTSATRSGWRVYVTASIAELPAETLPAETLAELKQVAAAAACEWTGGAGCAKPAGPDDHLCTGHRDTVRSAVQNARTESAAWS